MTRLTISLLGSLQVTLDGKPVTGFATDKARALLAYLVAEADHPHRRDALAGLLWPDQPQRKARQNLRQALSFLRQAIRDQNDDGLFLLVSRETIQFNPDCDYWLDVAAFTALVEACRGHQHRRLETCPPCIRRLEQMVELYRGDFLEHFYLSDSSLFEEWASLKREWLHREAVEALYHLANYYERRGDYDRARQYARRQVELEPWREEAHRQLMRLLALDRQRSAALAQYEACHRALATELGVEPTAETVTLYERIRAEEGLCPPATLHNLPPSPTPLIGREAELAELAELLAAPDCRLVTLCGPGGIGKTRLALKTAADQVGAFAHGVYFVPLAAVSSPDLIVPTIANALEFSFYGHEDTKEQLLNYLREKEMLLVLDNLEHILEGSKLLAEMLHHAPGVVILATSRERLNLQEEWVHEVEELTYPTDEATKDLEGYSAVELFLQSAHRTEQRFALSDLEAPYVVRICQMVGGIPLGVELAAAWVRVRSGREIAQEIERNLDILATRLRNVPERHQSIRATFEHSWRLLTQTEKDLLARLSIFRGGFRQEAATVVAGASPHTLSALLDKSLIRYISSDRYDMHGLLRQYAAEKLGANRQEYEKTQLKHARYFASFLERQKEHLKSTKQKQALQEIALEVENARQVWQLAVSRGWAQEVEQSLESLYHFYNIRCRSQEGIKLFAQAIDQWRGDLTQTCVFGKVLSRQGALYHQLGLYQQARTCLQQSLTVFKHLKMLGEQVFCLVSLANVTRSQGQYEETEQLAQRSLNLSRQIGDCWGRAFSLFLLGMVRYRAGDVDQAEALLEESLAISRESGNQRLIMSPLNGLGDIACHRGDYARAQAVFEECLALSHELGDQFNVSIHLNNLGTVLHVLNRYAEAQSFYQESLEICSKIGDQSGQAIALSNLGEVSYALGAPRDAQVFYQQGLAIGRNICDQWTIMACLNNLGEIGCALEDYEGAKAYFAEAMEIATETQALTVLLKVLVNLAVFFTKQGQTDRAVALFGLACRHPACEQTEQEKAERWLDEMGLVPPDNAPKPLDVVVAEILTEISPRSRISSRAERS
jgi:predicted ATPase/DNA-binding SARP family transcriptional activator/Tfp pilus assembly protein PilF